MVIILIVRRGIGGKCEGLGGGGRKVQAGREGEKETLEYRALRHIFQSGLPQLRAADGLWIWGSRYIILYNSRRPV